MLLPEPEKAFDQQAPGAAAWIINPLTGLGVEEIGHQDCDLPGSVELACALARAFCEFSQEVFIGPSNDIRFHILEPQPVPSENIDQGSEFLVADDPLASCSGVEIHDIDHALKFGVLPGNAPDRIGQVFADAGALL